MWDHTRIVSSADSAGTFYHLIGLWCWLMLHHRTHSPLRAVVKILLAHNLVLGLSRIACGVWSIARSCQIALLHHPCCLIIWWSQICDSLSWSWRIVALIVIKSCQAIVLGVICCVFSIKNIVIVRIVRVEISIVPMIVASLQFWAQIIKSALYHFVVITVNMLILIILIATIISLWINKIISKFSSYLGRWLLSGFDWDFCGRFWKTPNKLITLLRLTISTLFRLLQIY